MEIAFDAASGDGEDVLAQARDLFRVATVYEPTAAHILKGVLVAAGIPAVVADDQLVQANTLLTMAVGGVRILVPRAHLAEAEAILAAYERGEFQLREDEDPAV